MSMEQIKSIGEFYGHETISTELKEFCLKICPSLILSKNEIRKILTNGYWNPKLTNFIISNLKLYIKYYLPKYLIGFLKSNIDGKLVIGVNDMGIITGIPSKIPITNLLINEMIAKNIKEYINDYEILKCIDVNVEKLKINPLLVDKEDFSKMFYDFEKKIEKHKKRLLKFKKKKNKWLFEVDMYRSLHNIINLPIPKQNFIKYITRKKDLSHIVKQLNETRFIKIPDFKILINCKLDNTNIFYWLMKFKDIVSKKICKKRPVKPLSNLKINLKAYISQITKLNYDFIKQKDINYYIIIIKINGSKYKLNSDIKYKMFNSSKWKSPERTIINGEPCCI